MSSSKGRPPFSLTQHSDELYAGERKHRLRKLRLDLRPVAEVFPSHPSPEEKAASLDFCLRDRVRGGCLREEGLRSIWGRSADKAARAGLNLLYDNANEARWAVRVWPVFFFKEQEYNSQLTPRERQENAFVFGTGVHGEGYYLVREKPECLLGDASPPGGQGGSLLGLGFGSPPSLPLGDGLPDEGLLGGSSAGGACSKLVPLLDFGASCPGPLLRAAYVGPRGEFFFGLTPAGLGYYAKRPADDDVEFEIAETFAGPREGYFFGCLPVRDAELTDITVLYLGYHKDVHVSAKSARSGGAASARGVGASARRAATGAGAVGQIVDTAAAASARLFPGGRPTPATARTNPAGIYVEKNAKVHENFATKAFSASGGFPSAKRLKTTDVEAPDADQKRNTTVAAPRTQPTMNYALEYGSVSGAASSAERQRSAGANYATSSAPSSQLPTAAATSGNKATQSLATGARVLELLFDVSQRDPSAKKFLAQLLQLCQDGWQRCSSLGYDYVTTEINSCLQEPTGQQVVELSKSSHSTKPSNKVPKNCNSTRRPRTDPAFLGGTQRPYSLRQFVFDRALLAYMHHMHGLAWRPFFNEHRVLAAMPNVRMFNRFLQLHGDRNGSIFLRKNAGPLGSGHGGGAAVPLGSYNPHLHTLKGGIMGGSASGAAAQQLPNSSSAWMGDQSLYQAEEDIYTWTRTSDNFMQRSLLYKASNRSLLEDDIGINSQIASSSWASREGGELLNGGKALAQNRHNTHLQRAGRTQNKETKAGTNTLTSAAFSSRAVGSSMSSAATTVNGMTVFQPQSRIPAPGRAAGSGTTTCTAAAHTDKAAATQTTKMKPPPRGCAKLNVDFSSSFRAMHDRLQFQPSAAQCDYRFVHRDDVVVPGYGAFSSSPEDRVEEGGRDPFSSSSCTEDATATPRRATTAGGTTTSTPAGFRLVSRAVKLKQLSPGARHATSGASLWAAAEFERSRGLRAQQEVSVLPPPLESAPPGWQDLYPMRGDQLAALTWMRERELSCEPFTAYFHRFLCGRFVTQDLVDWDAHLRLKAKFRSRGGILANPVGAGKTAIVLALLGKDSEIVFPYEEAALQGKDESFSIPEKPPSRFPDGLEHDRRDFEDGQQDVDRLLLNKDGATSPKMKIGRPPTKDKRSAVSKAIAAKAKAKAKAKAAAEMKRGRKGEGDVEQAGGAETKSRKIVSTSSSSSSAAKMKKSASSTAADQPGEDVGDGGGAGKEAQRQRVLEQLRDDIRSGKRQRLRISEQEAQLLEHDSFFPSKATLVLVPTHLIDQWEREVVKFLPNEKLNVLVLRNVNPLKLLTAGDLQRADIIICSYRIIFSELYQRVRLKELLFAHGSSVALAEADATSATAQQKVHDHREVDDSPSVVEKNALGGTAFTKSGADVSTKPGAKDKKAAGKMIAGAAASNPDSTTGKITLNSNFSSFATKPTLNLHYQPIERGAEDGDGAAEPEEPSAPPLALFVQDRAYSTRTKKSKVSQIVNIMDGALQGGAGHAGGLHGRAGEAASDPLAPALTGAARERFQSYTFSDRERIMLNVLLKDQTRLFRKHPLRFQHWHDSLKEGVKQFRHVHRQSVLLAAAGRFRTTNGHSPEQRRAALESFIHELPEIDEEGSDDSPSNRDAPGTSTGRGGSSGFAARAFESPLGRGRGQSPSGRGDPRKRDWSLGPLGSSGEKLPKFPRMASPEGEGAEKFAEKKLKGILKVGGARHNSAKVVVDKAKLKKALSGRAKSVASASAFSTFSAAASASTAKAKVTKPPGMKKRVIRKRHRPVTYKGLIIRNDKNVSKASVLLESTQRGIWTEKEPREDSLQDTEFFTLAVREFRRVRLLGTNEECAELLRIERAQDLLFPLLEMFVWKRVVFDEFHELESFGQKEMEVLLRFKALSKWGLTGSPGAYTVRSVAAMASLLSVDLMGVSKEETGLVDQVHQYAEACASTRSGDDRTNALSEHLDTYLAQDEYNFDAVTQRLKPCVDWFCNSCGAKLLLGYQNPYVFSGHLRCGECGALNHDATMFQYSLPTKADGSSPNGSPGGSPPAWQDKVASPPGVATTGTTAGASATDEAEEHPQTPPRPLPPLGAGIKSPSPANIPSRSQSPDMSVNAVDMSKFTAKLGTPLLVQQTCRAFRHRMFAQEQNPLSSDHAHAMQNDDADRRRLHALQYRNLNNGCRWQRNLLSRTSGGKRGQMALLSGSGASQLSSKLDVVAVPTRSSARRTGAGGAETDANEQFIVPYDRRCTSTIGTALVALDSRMSYGEFERQLTKLENRVENPNTRGFTSSSSADEGSNLNYPGAATALPLPRENGLLPLNSLSATSAELFQAPDIDLTLATAEIEESIPGLEHEERSFANVSYSFPPNGRHAFDDANSTVLLPPRRRGEVEQRAQPEPSGERTETLATLAEEQKVLQQLDLFRNAARPRKVAVPSAFALQRWRALAKHPFDRNPVFRANATRFLQEYVWRRAFSIGVKLVQHVVYVTQMPQERALYLNRLHSLPTKVVVAHGSAYEKSLFPDDQDEGAEDRHGRSSYAFRSSGLKGNGNGAVVKNMSGGRGNNVQEQSYPGFLAGDHATQDKERNRSCFMAISGADTFPEQIPNVELERRKDLLQLCSHFTSYSGQSVTGECQRVLDNRRKDVEKDLMNVMYYLKQYECCIRVRLLGGGNPDVPSSAAEDDNEDEYGGTSCWSHHNEDRSGFFGFLPAARKVKKTVSFADGAPSGSPFGWGVGGGGQAVFGEFAAFGGSSSSSSASNLRSHAHNATGGAASSSFSKFVPQTTNGGSSSSSSSRMIPSTAHFHHLTGASSSSSSSTGGVGAASSSGRRVTFNSGTGSPSSPKLSVAANLCWATNRELNRDRLRLLPDAVARKWKSMEARALSESSEEDFGGSKMKGPKKKARASSGGNASDPLDAGGVAFAYRARVNKMNSNPHDPNSHLDLTGILARLQELWEDDLPTLSSRQLFQIAFKDNRPGDSERLDALENVGNESRRKKEQLLQTHERALSQQICAQIDRLLVTFQHYNFFRRTLDVYADNSTATGGENGSSAASSGAEDDNDENIEGNEEVLQQDDELFDGVDDKEDDGIGGSGLKLSGVTMSYRRIVSNEITCQVVGRSSAAAKTKSAEGGGNAAKAARTVKPTSKPGATQDTTDEATKKKNLKNTGSIKEGGGNKRYCGICADYYEVAELGITPCAHVFCIVCLNAMVENQRKCALCRQPLFQKDILSLSSELGVGGARANGSNAGSMGVSGADTNYDYPNDEAPPKTKLKGGVLVQKRFRYERLTRQKLIQQPAAIEREIDVTPVGARGRKSDEKAARRSGAGSAKKDGPDASGSPQNKKTGAAGTGPGTNESEAAKENTPLVEPGGLAKETTEAYDQVVKHRIEEIDASRQLPVSIDIAQQHGSKMQKLADLLTKIKSDDPTAKILVYTQWDQLKKQIYSALRLLKSIHCVIFSGGVSQKARLLRQFANAEPGKRQADVLLLSMEVPASGLNLVLANHVVFVHPLSLGCEEEVRTAEAQAIGRMARPGQSREEIHVWRLATQNTIEEDLVRQRCLLPAATSGGGAGAGVLEKK